MPYPPKLQEFLDTLSFFPDRTERIEALISVAERFTPMPEDVATKPYDEAARVPGCESEAFVWARPLPDGTLKFSFAVENPQGVSAKALAAILDETLSGEPLDQVAQVPDEVVFDIFGRELSMGKSMGLTGMVRMVTAEARKRLAP
jgi:cysteine desulfuration protein SufE